MSLNDTPSGERTTIAFFGVRNAGKSSVVNAVCGQDLAVVSDVLGTTTDPVRKAMELLPLGPVVVVDTPGIDDAGELGELRVEKTRRVLRGCDVAVLVVDGTRGLTAADEQLLGEFAAREVPYLVAWNKVDAVGAAGAVGVAGEAGAAGVPAAVGAAGAAGVPAPTGALCPVPETLALHTVGVSAKTGEGIDALKERLASLAPAEQGEPRVLAADLVPAGGVAVLVCPIDESAPKGRLILPQQQVIRDLLDHGRIPVVCRETELAATLAALREAPSVVITDSQAFGPVSRIVPPEIPLTSFSILMVRYKGDLVEAVRGAAKLDSLRDGDRILVSEGCSHRRQCNDIGTVKLPRWLREYTGANLEFEFTSGVEFPEDPSRYALCVHCGGCMLNAREMRARQRAAVTSGVPVTNYGIAIAQVHGILRRSLTPFPEVLAALG